MQSGRLRTALEEYLIVPQGKADGIGDFVDHKLLRRSVRETRPAPVAGDGNESRRFCGVPGEDSVNEITPCFILYLVACVYLILVLLLLAVGHGQCSHYGCAKIAAPFFLFCVDSVSEVRGIRGLALTS